METIYNAGFRIGQASPRICRMRLHFSLIPSLVRRSHLSVNTQAAVPQHSAMMFFLSPWQAFHDSVRLDVLLSHDAEFTHLQCQIEPQTMRP